MVGIEYPHWTGEREVVMWTQGRAIEVVMESSARSGVTPCRNDDYKVDMHSLFLRCTSSGNKH